jgi:hypothetical protein
MNLGIFAKKKQTFVNNHFSRKKLSPPKILFGIFIILKFHHSFISNESNNFSNLNNAKKSHMNILATRD